MKIMDRRSEFVLLTAGEAAAILRVDPKTVGRWCKAGLLWSVKTPGGHHRVKEADIRAIANGEVVLP